MMSMYPRSNFVCCLSVYEVVIILHVLSTSYRYIRVGNGNQLVRDPKKLVRILANEKIRWSLHTARLRSVRKQQYCQFFTRFGKCNKEDGKCPYIHDPTKIAICTKFLKGLCSSPNCKLTHKVNNICSHTLLNPLLIWIYFLTRLSISCYFLFQVIPERMPDCSYFLQGDSLLLFLPHIAFFANFFEKII